MSDPPLFLDVNVPMYAAGKPHPYQRACAWILSQVADGQLPVVIDTEIIQEILYRYGALQEWDIAVAMAQAMRDLVPDVLPVTPADMQEAVRLFARYAPGGVKARDVIHAAVMQRHGLATIVSTDRHFDQIEGISRLDPRELFATHPPLFHDRAAE